MSELSTKVVPLMFALGAWAVVEILSQGATGDSGRSLFATPYEVLLATLAALHVFPLYRFHRKHRDGMDAADPRNRLVRVIRYHVLLFALTVSWEWLVFAVFAWTSPVVLLLWIFLIWVLVHDFWPGFLKATQQWLELDCDEIVDKVLIEVTEFCYLVLVVVAGLGSTWFFTFEGESTKSREFARNCLIASPLIIGASAVLLLYAYFVMRIFDKNYDVARFYARCRERLHIWIWIPAVMVYIVAFAELMGRISILRDNDFFAVSACLIWVLIPLVCIPRLRNLIAWRWRRVINICMLGLTMLLLLMLVPDPPRVWLMAAVASLSLLMLLLYAGRWNE